MSEDTYVVTKGEERVVHWLLELTISLNSFLIEPENAGFTLKGKEEN